MAFDCGPERVVRVPGARARELSREVANVRVVKGRLGLRGSVSFLGGRWGSRNVRLEEGKVRASRDILFCFFLLVIGLSGLVVRGILGV